jgi:hypothetical protein
MRVRLGEAAMVSDDFRSTDTVRFPASLDGLRKHFFDIARVLDTTDIDFRCHSIRGTEMDAADAAQALVKILPKCNVPDTIQLDFILAQVEAATLDDEFGLGQGVLRKGQRQRKDGVAFSVSPENLFFVQVDAELAVFEGGHDMAPFVMGFVWVVGITFYNEYIIPCCDDFSNSIQCASTQVMPGSLLVFTLNRFLGSPCSCLLRKGRILCRIVLPKNCYNYH